MHTVKVVDGDERALIVVLLDDEIYKADEKMETRALHKFMSIGCTREVVEAMVARGTKCAERNVRQKIGDTAGG